MTGLDAASSFELLSHLNQLADSNRTVILTIHQPRLEIFHMFHRLVLLCDGKVRKWLHIQCMMSAGSVVYILIKKLFNMKHKIPLLKISEGLQQNV